MGTRTAVNSRRTFRIGSHPRRVVADAFLAAMREDGADALANGLGRDVVARAGQPVTAVVSGAVGVAHFAGLAPPALVDGAIAPIADGTPQRRISLATDPAPNRP